MENCFWIKDRERLYNIIIPKEIIDFEISVLFPSLSPTTYRFDSLSAMLIVCECAYIYFNSMKMDLFSCQTVALGPSLTVIIILCLWHHNLLCVVSWKVCREKNTFSHCFTFSNCNKINLSTPLSASQASFQHGRMLWPKFVVVFGLLKVESLPQSLAWCHPHTQKRGRRERERKKRKLFTYEILKEN